VGYPSELEHGLAAEPEDLQAHRGVAQPRAIEGDFPYVYLDGVVLKRSWAGEVAANISVLVAIGVGTDGYRQILGVAEGEKEDLEGWRGFLRHLKESRLKGVQCDDLRCLPRTDRSGRRALPRGSMAEMRGALVSQRLQSFTAR